MSSLDYTTFRHQDVAASRPFGEPHFHCRRYDPAICRTSLTHKSSKIDNFLILVWIRRSVRPLSEVNESKTHEFRSLLTRQKPRFSCFGMVVSAGGIKESTKRELTKQDPSH